MASISDLIGSTVISGTTKADTIVVKGSNTTVNAGAGNDVIEVNLNYELANSSTSNILINAEADADSVFIGENVSAVTVNGGTGADTINNYGSDILINSNADDDYISSSSGQNVTINAGIGDDTIYNTSGYTTLNGGADSDSIVNRGSNVFIDGGEGADDIKLYSVSKNVTVNAGKGKDTIEASFNPDVFIYAEGDGNDLIKNYDSDDTINITSDTFYGTVASGSDVILSIGSGSITLENALSKALNIVGGISTIGSVIVNTKSGEVVEGTAYADTITNSGENVTINSGTGNDVIINEELGIQNIINGGAGADSVYNAGSNVTINADEGSDTINNEGWNTSINGGDGNDIITTSKTYNVTIAGGKGNDTLTGSSLAEVFVYTKGDGNDIITNYGSNDTINIIEGNNYSTLVSGDDVIVSVGSGTITLQNSKGKTLNIVNGNLPETTSGEYISITNPISNTVVSGSSGDDSIKINTAEKITINAGLGNDTVNSNHYEAVYLYAAGDGKDIITANSNDTIKITSGTYSTQKSGNDLVLNVGNGSITVKDAANQRILIQNSSGSIDTINSAGKVVIGNLADTISINGSANDDKIYNIGSNVTINAGAGNDTILNYKDTAALIQYSAGDGNDVIASYNDDKNIVAYSGNDTIQIANGTYSTEISGDDVIITVGVNSLTVKNAKDKTLNIIGEKTIDTITVDEDENVNNVISEVQKNIRRTIEDSGLSSLNTSITESKISALIANSKKSSLDNVPTISSSVDTLLSGNAVIAIPTLEAADTLTVDFNDNGIKLVKMLHDVGNVNLNFSDSGHNAIVIGSSVTGSEKITAGNPGKGQVGDTLYNFSKKANVTMIGGTGNDYFHAANSSDVIDLTGGGADTIDATLSGASVKGYDVSQGAIFVVNETNQTALLEDMQSGKIALDGGKFTLNGATEGIALVGTNTNRGTFARLVTNDKTSLYGDELLYGWSSKTGGTVDGSGSNEKQVLIGNGDTISSTLIGGSANDTIISSANDVVSLSSGRDLIIGKANSAATFIYDTNAKINSTIENYSANDTLKVQTAALTASTVGSNLVLSAGEGTVYLKDYTASTLNINDKVITITDILIGETINNTQRQQRLVGSDSADTIVNSGGKVTIEAGKGNDTILNYGGRAVINSDQGNDLITSAGSRATINSGAGNDTINLSGSNNLIKYTSGADVITGIKSNDTIQIADSYTTSKSGNDMILTTGNGSITLKDSANQRLIVNSTVINSESAVNISNVQNLISLVGSSKADTIVNSAAFVTIDAGSGADYIDVSGGNVSIIGGKGKDTIVLDGSGNIVEYAEGDGNDTIIGYNSTDTIEITEGIFSTVSSGSDIVIKVGKGSLTLKDAQNAKLNIKTSGKANLIYNDVKDRVTLNAAFSGTLDSTDYDSTVKLIDATQVTSAVSIVGNKLANTIRGTAKADTIYGGVGADILYGNKGADILYGDNGHDTLAGGKGKDILYGGNGKDVFIYNDGDGVDVIADFTEGQDTIKLTDATISSASVNASDVVLKIGSGSITIKDAVKKTISILDANNKLNSFIQGSTSSESLLGTSDADSIFGDTGADTIYGYAGADYLSGGKGADIIDGGNGADTIIGGKGKDTLTGGKGKNVFIYNDGDGDDVITDYKSTDTLQINGSSSLETNGEDVIITVGKGSITLTGAKDKKINIEPVRAYAEKFFDDDNYSSSDLNSILDNKTDVLVDYSFDDVKKKDTFTQIALNQSTKK